MEQMAEKTVSGAAAAERTPALLVRPRFELASALAECIPATLLGAFLIPLVAGTLLFILLSLTGLSRFVSIPAVYGGLLFLCLVVIPPAFYEVRRRALSRTLYRFQGGYLDFQFFRYYLIRQRGRIRLADIENVSERAGVLQERLGLTTVYLLVPGLSYQAQGGFPGLKLSDIPGGRGAARRIQEQIEAAT